MKIWKLLVLLAGIAGVIGFFTPMVDYRSADGKLTGDASAFQMARRGGAHDLIGPIEHLALPRGDGERFIKAFDAVLEAYRDAILVSFAPAGLLAALGILLMLRDRMGRLSALCAIALGGACGAVFARFWQADQASHDPGASLGLGVYLLLAAGLGGVLAGLGALVSPDRG
jgi:hypothetical protein